jgi:hypothetical protein
VQTLFEHAGGRPALRRFSSQVAMQNSTATTDAELHPLRDVSIWHWPNESRC